MVGKQAITRRGAGVVLLGGVAAAACQPAAAPGVPSLLEGRFADWAQTILSDDPELATQAGVSDAAVGGRFADRLKDRSAAASERRRTAALRRIVELNTIKLAAPADPSASLPVVAAHFEAAAGLAQFNYGRFAPLAGAQPYVIDHVGAAYVRLPAFLELRQPMESLDQAGDYLGRLEEVAGAIDAEADHARKDAEAGVLAPQFILRAAYDLTVAVLSQPIEANAFAAGFSRRIDALVTPMDDPTQVTQAQSRATSLKAKAEHIVRAKIIPAHARLAQTLSALGARAALDAGVWRLPDGEAYYAACLAFETSTTLSPQEIHQIGRDQVAELTATLDAALRRMGRTEGGVGERMAALTADPAYRYANDDSGRAQLIADARARIAAASSRAGAWFGALPAVDLEVRRAPTLAEAGTSGGYYEPPGAAGRQSAVYYINLRDTADLTRIDLPTQDYHEGVPGHHLQTIIARAIADLPLLRRLFTFSAFSEGWGVYAEQLADEQDLHAQDPIGRIGYLRWRLWRAARLMVDTGLHALRWPREQAVATLAQITGDGAAVINAEVDRYVAYPGRACSYELGRAEFVRLREYARRAMGTRFTLKDFHDQALGAGELPLPLLAARINAWVAQNGGAPAP